MNPDELDVMVRQAQAGDREAFDRIVIALEGEIRVSLAAYQPGAGLAEEILQQAFVIAYSKLHLYRPQGTFRPWLKAIARNQLFKELSELRRFAASEGDQLGQLLVSSALDDLDQAEELEARMKRLRACVEKLPPSARALVEGRYVAEQTSARLAERFERTEIWVRVSLCRIRRVLRDCVETGTVEA